MQHYSAPHITLCLAVLLWVDSSGVMGGCRWCSRAHLLPCCGLLWPRSWMLFCTGWQVCGLDNEGRLCTVELSEPFSSYTVRPHTDINCMQLSVFIAICCSILSVLCGIYWVFHWPYGLGCLYLSLYTLQVESHLINWMIQSRWTQWNLSEQITIVWCCLRCCYLRDYLGLFFGSLSQSLWFLLSWIPVVFF